MAAVKAFREPQLVTDPLGDDGAEFNTWQARQTRYAILWAYLENTAYRRLHSWSERYKVDYGLYKFVRNIYNPAYRLAEFYRAHVFGGQLKIDSDGAMEEGAIPIVTDNAALRPAIAQLWRASNWQVNKGVVVLRGAALGDTAIQIIDDPRRRRVYMIPRHPGQIRSVTLDEYGNVKGYEVVERRLDPRIVDPTRAREVEYLETATRDGDDVVYATYMDGAPFAWNGEAAEWREPYGFVPMVLAQHNTVGQAWGWAELFPALSKVREVDDIASKLSDQIRKSVDPAWFFTGVSKPGETRMQSSATGSTQRADEPEKGRQDVPAIYAPSGSTASPLLANVDIDGVLSHVTGIVAELERDYPELKVDELRLSGGLTGRAMKLAQQPAEDKVIERRPNYDDALVRAQQMAVAIGGFRGYDGYQGFGLDSYAAGDLEHRIGDRPVFGADPLEDVEYDTAFWGAIRAAQSAGVPLAVALGWQGYTDADIAEITSSAEYQQRQAIQAAGLFTPRAG